MRGGRVAVIGGSIAGCAVALAAHRAGAAEVVVYERTPGRLEDRGVGLGVRTDLYEELAAAGYLEPGTPHTALDRRVWWTADGSRAGRVVGAMDFSFRAYDWGSLWRSLRDRVPERVDYRRDAAVVSVAGGHDGARVTLAGGVTERFDLVVGADGYRSAVREAMFPRVRPAWSGYLLWRGTAPAALAPAPPEGLRGGDAAMVGFPGGHAMVFVIPGRDGTRTINWAVYADPPDDAAYDPADTAGMPPGRVTGALLDHLYGPLTDAFPPYWAELVRLTPEDEVIVQPIHDLHSASYTRGRLALAGDAAAVVRPHTGGGAVKALQDAAALEEALSGTDDVDAALVAYDVRRAPIGRSMVALGRALGDAQVLRTPDWAAMGQAGLLSWWRSIPSGTAGLGGTALR